MRLELNYNVPFERLLKLGRSIGRKAYADVWRLRWLLIVVFLAGIAAFAALDRQLAGWTGQAGIPFGANALIAGWFVLFVAGILSLRRFAARRMRSRAEFDSPVRMTQEEEGLRFATASIEYYVKWRGISQLLLERDGVVVSHGGLFWLIPDAAFHGAAERRAFIQDVYGHLGETARARSEKQVRAVLAA